MKWIPFEGEVKADGPRRMTASVSPLTESRPAADRGELPDLRDFIRSRRAALAGFMEQGASLEIDVDLLTVTPRSDIYVRYLTDNRNVIGELASELYGRRIKVEMGSVSGAAPSRSDQPGGLSIAQDLRPSPLAPASSTDQVQADPRQQLYADPVVRRIFEEFDARLVELKSSSTRTDTSAPSVDKK
jgi:hypothetical protein